MALDPITLLFAVLLVMVLTTGAFLLTWLQNRRETAMLWMAAATGLGCAGIAARSVLPFVMAMLWGNFLLLIGFGLIATACRRLHGRAVLPFAIVVPGMIWLGLCGLPGFLADVYDRDMAACLLILFQIGVALRALRPARRDNPAARSWLIAVLSAQGVAVFARGVNALLHDLIQPIDVVPVDHSVALMIDGLVFVLSLGFGMITFVKERSEDRHRLAARLDPMTGVGNRRHFEECLRLHLHLAYQTMRPLALIMIDADHFKAYNDLYGHPAGDTCLRELAMAIAGACRPTDVVARYGGEEFAVLLPDTTQRDASSIAERMRMRVRQLHLEHAGRPDGIATISLGAASLTPSRARASAEDLLRAADGALYGAKKAGRDQTCWAWVRPELAAFPVKPDTAVTKHASTEHIFR